MPKEIKITPGTPDSTFSAISGATGLHTTENQLALGGRSMFKSVLPQMSSETEECSLDRSTYSWASKVVKSSVNKAGDKSGNRNSRSEKKLSNSGSSGKRSSIGGFFIGGSSRSLMSDDFADPSRKLFAKSPTKGK